MKNTMKAVLVGMMSFLLMSVVLTGCQSELEKKVAEAQKELPYDAGDGISITKFEISGDDLVCTISYDESELRMDSEEFKTAMDYMGAEIQKAFLEEMRSGDDEDMKELFDLCKKENKGISFNMYGEKSKKSITLGRIDPKDM